MINQSTIDKLIEMRLSSMADAFRIQMNDPSMKEVPFEDRFGMLVDVEYTNRKNNRLKRLIRKAEGVNVVGRGTVIPGSYSGSLSQAQITSGWKESSPDKVNGYYKDIELISAQELKEKFEKNGGNHD